MKTPNRFLALTVAAFGAAAVLATPAAAEVHVGFSVNLPAPPLPPLPFPAPNLRVGFGGPHGRYLPPLPPLPPSVTYRRYAPRPRPGWIWVAGYWERNAYDRAYWVPGHWVRSGRAYGYGYGGYGRYDRFDRHDRYDRRDRYDRYRDRDDDRW